VTDRAKGCIAHGSQETDYRWAGATASGSTDLTYPEHFRFADRWHDQSAGYAPGFGSSSCTGHGVVGGGELFRNIRGIPRVRMSYMDAYAKARLWSLPYTTRLADMGDRKGDTPLKQAQTL